MQYFTAEAVVPLRAQANESAEMVSQLVFGDFVEGGEEQESWIQIRNLEDGYEGWVTKKMLAPVPDGFQTNIDWAYVREGFDYLVLSDNSRMLLPLGARVPLAAIVKGGFRIGDLSWQTDDGFSAALAAEPSQRFAIARAFLNTPYLWGGRAGFGIDCSGLTQSVFRMCGTLLPRDASQQYLKGEEISFEKLATGDLAFFAKNNPERITHVGIIGPGAQIIHSSGRVRIDKLSNKGIIHSQNGQLTHKLVSIKRYG